MTKWEYWTGILMANSDDEREYLKGRWPDWDPPKHAPQATIPALNRFGKSGWELVHMQPVYAGNKFDIAQGGDIRHFANSYFCVFKRPVPDEEDE